MRWPGHDDKKRRALNDAPVSRFAVIASADAAAEVIEKFAKNVEMIVPLFVSRRTERSTELNVSINGLRKAR